MSYVFRGKGIQAQSRFGPVSRDEISQRFWDEDFEAEDRKQLPQVALLVDIDCYRHDVSSESITNIFKFSQGIAQRLFDNIKGRLT